jgi:hypothetical protein
LINASCSLLNSPNRLCTQNSMNTCQWHKKQNSMTTCHWYKKQNSMTTCHWYKKQNSMTTCHWYKKQNSMTTCHWYKKSLVFQRSRICSQQNATIIFPLFVFRRVRNIAKSDYKLFLGCWISKATRAYAQKYVILIVFPRQQRFYETANWSASILIKIETTRTGALHD